MTRPRDSQYAKFWKATKVIEPFGQTFATEKNVETYVRKSAARAFLTRRYPLHGTFTVNHLPRTQREKGDYWSVSIPADSRHTRTVIYCLTRLIWSRAHPRSAFTGWQWAMIYLDVVQALMGRPAADLLKASYRVHGVQYREKP
jgi:hypothetical protein